MFIRIYLAGGSPSPPDRQQYHKPPSRLSSSDPVYTFNTSVDVPPQVSYSDSQLYQTCTQVNSSLPTSAENTASPATSHSLVTGGPCLSPTSPQSVYTSPVQLTTKNTSADLSSVCNNSKVSSNTSNSLPKQSFSIISDDETTPWLVESTDSASNDHSIPRLNFETSSNSSPVVHNATCDLGTKSETCRDDTSNNINNSPALSKTLSTVTPPRLNETFDRAPHPNGGDIPSHSSEVAMDINMAPVSYSCGTDDISSQGSEVLNAPHIGIFTSFIISHLNEASLVTSRNCIS